MEAERLTSNKRTAKREMICRYEDCDTCEEYCPDLNEDNCPCLQEVLEKLAEYEDLEEQGRLLKLPCAVGDTVYIISRKQILPIKVLGIQIFILDGKLETQIKCNDGVSYGYIHFLSKEISKSVFLTKEQAEAALKNYEHQRVKVK